MPIKYALKNGKYALKIFKNMLLKTYFSLKIRTFELIFSTEEVNFVEFISIANKKKELKY